MLTHTTDTLTDRDALTEQLMLVAIAARCSTLHHLLPELQTQLNMLVTRAGGRGGK